MIFNIVVQGVHCNVLDVLIVKSLISPFVFDQLKMH